MEQRIPEFMEIDPAEEKNILILRTSVQILDKMLPSVEQAAQIIRKASQFMFP